jgi:hypothetical protein
MRLWQNYILIFAYGQSQMIERLMFLDFQPLFVLSSTNTQQ